MDQMPDPLSTLFFWFKRVPDLGPEHRVKFDCTLSAGLMINGLRPLGGRATVRRLAATV
jgi:hypothetical protein